MIKKVVGLYFSPSGDTSKLTKRVAEELANRMNDTCIDDIGVSYIDLLRNPLMADENFDEETIVVVGMPAFNGRVPLPCVKMIQKMHGSHTLTVCVVDYGNSSYGDALYELYTFLEDQGFDVLSAGAFVSQHAIFKKIASCRPDLRDIQMVKEFCELTAKKLHRFCGSMIQELRPKVAPLDIKGSMPSKAPLRLPIHPTPNKHCIQCGECAKICPMGAINLRDVTKVDSRKCISCTACVRTCPVGARDFHGPMCAASGLALEKLYSKRKDPEWFL
ncbi:MAG: 4Fe-4S binding protein [Eubacteriales bacterium]|nr:4Fe-4S binding protein [Eubacteriales bacterium]